MKKNKKFAVLSILAAGTLFQFGGCFSGWLNSLIPGLAGSLLAEFLTDNDAIFDLFEDGATAQ